ncbi:MAG: FISUMP domain-containing protein [bacterium]
MYLKKIMFLLTFIILFTLHCDIIEPDNKTGSIIIYILSDITKSKIFNPRETLSIVQCIVKKGSHEIYDQHHTKRDSSYFTIKINDLEPADTYSVLLYGKNSSGDIMGRADKGNIRVVEGIETPVSMSWSNMRPVLFSPADSSIIYIDTLSFDWSSVSNAAFYELQVDSSDSFSAPIIDQNRLTDSGYTTVTSFSDNTYYWRVRCQDSRENWGEWSDIWSFIVSTKMITVTSPNGGESWELGSSQTITWTSSNAGIEVKIELYRGSNQYQTIAASTPNDGSYTWSVPSDCDADSSYRIKITSPDDADIYDYSDDYFILYTINYVKIYGVCFVYFGPDTTLHIDGVTMTFNTTSGGTMTTTTNSPYGYYEQEVPYGWSGTLSASKQGYDFKCDYHGSLQSEYHFDNIIKDTKVDFWDNRSIDSTGTLTDIDGNTYQTVKIGDQWWMAENLKVTHYRNGDAIPHIPSETEWHKLYLHKGAYCAYDNEESNADVCGYLYNWCAVDDSRNIAPEGWHVPTTYEWRKLERELGMSQSEADDTGWRGTNEGNKLKSTSGWHQGANGTDENGFCALPGGYRDPNGFFRLKGYETYFWTSSEFNDYSAWIRRLAGTKSGVYSNNHNKRLGLSVRLVKD